MPPLSLILARFFFDAKDRGGVPHGVKSFYKTKTRAKTPEYRKGNTYNRRQEAKKEKECYTKGAIQSAALGLQSIQPETN